MNCLTLIQTDLNSEIITSLPSIKPFTIGRSSRSDVRIELLGMYVSRFHAKITPGDCSWRVEDLASRNGIFNDFGEKVPSIVLGAVGDNCWIAAPRNSLGSIRLTVEDAIHRRSLETIRVDLKAWADRVTTSIGELQELIERS